MKGVQKTQRDHSKHQKHLCSHTLTFTVEKKTSTTNKNNEMIEDKKKKKREKKITKYDISSTIKNLNLNLNYHYYATKYNLYIIYDHVIRIEDTLDRENGIQFIERSWHPVTIA